MSKSRKIAQQDKYVLVAKEEFYQKLTEVEQFGEDRTTVLNLMSVLRKQLDNIIEDALEISEVRKSIDIQDACFECLTLTELISKTVNVRMFEAIGQFAYLAKKIVETDNNRLIISSNTQAV